MPKISMGYKGKKKTNKSKVMKPMSKQLEGEFTVQLQQHNLPKVYEESKKVKPQDVFVGYKQTNKKNKKKKKK
jgi:hypothetical protein